MGEKETMTTVKISLEMTVPNSLGKYFLTPRDTEK